MGFKVLRAPTQTELWHDVTRWHLYKPEVDYYATIGTNLNNVILEAQSMEFEFDLRSLWLNRSRWTRLTREYLNGPETTDFVRRSREILTDKGRNGVITQMQFATVQRYAKKHKWGGCLMSATFRGHRKRNIIPTLTLHSRVSYNCYMLGMDFCLAHVLAREISQGDPGQIRLQWHFDVLQTHSFKSLPFIYSQPDLLAELVRSGKQEPNIDDEGFRNEYPTWRAIGKWWDTVRRYEEEGKTVAEEVYGPLKRIRRRWEEHKQGIYVPSVRVEELDFGKVEGYVSL